MSYGARLFFRRRAAVANLWRRLLVGNCCVGGQSIVTQLKLIRTEVVPLERCLSCATTNSTIR